MKHAVEQTLEEIGAGERPRLLVLNKVDLLDEEARDELRLRHPEAVLVSGVSGEGLRGAWRGGSSASCGTRCAAWSCSCPTPMAAASPSCTSSPGR